MTADTSVAVNLGTIIALTLVTTSILKGLLEAFVSPDARLHDPLIQLLALLCGVGWSFVLALANGPLNRGVTVQAIVSVILGLSGGAGSIGAYHTSTALRGTAGGASAPPVPLQEQAPVGPSVRAGAEPVPAPAAWTSSTTTFAPASPAPTDEPQP